MTAPQITVREIFHDCDHSGLFPSPGGAKVAVAGDRLYVTYGLQGGGSVVRAFDGRNWESSPRFKMHPPYLAIDTRGYIHVAGPHDEHRQSIFYCRSTRTLSLAEFQEGEVIHPKNYTSMAVDDRDDTLFYFGTGVADGALAFRTRTSSGQWSPRQFLAQGQLIYPGVVIRDGIIHLMVGGWDPPAAIYESVFYFRSADRGKTWTRADGTPIKTPFEYDPNDANSLEQLDRVTRSLIRHGVADTNTHNKQLLIDRRGRPHILYSVVPAFFPMPKPQPRITHVHAFHDSKRWRYSYFSNDPHIDLHGPAICEDSEGRLHCVLGFIPAGRQHGDLGYCFSDDDGAHWSSISRVTKDADQSKRGYSYLHWAPKPWRRNLWFVCNRPGGGPLVLGKLPLNTP